MSGHVPVLAEEAVSALRAHEGGAFVDATFGAGGYTELLLAGGGRVFAFDRDRTAIEAGRVREASSDGRLTLIEAPFADMRAALGVQGALPVDGVVFDLGVSSMQLDQAERGFSFLRDGPLDMRMGAGIAAAAFVNEADEADIANVIYQYGEERRSRRLAHAIVLARQEAPIETTGRLAAIAERALGTREKIHPATRMFQAIRILVNDELGQVVRGLVAAEACLRAGGRLAVVTFHSLEDRIAKRFIAAASGSAESRSRHQPAAQAEAATLIPIGRKPIAPSEAEVRVNPRARSAKLRVAERTEQPLREWSDERLSALGAPPITFSPLQARWAS
ncbi:16S rRNA (cytosine(1402)-N(4))-methyltransferase RsmH [Parvularcula dongshanensis]|uniref:Ribosomal RNA small subunit methyltransferase H n=1 Tax=Parvularcula dongshanensis TaxID=1173995 RepID=A0A840I4H0_9PROT|nr:16S rRNA (cytosine(1402)-N(4))-methyltransferase RsmH [Parvularcula dongshanensis]MBB4659876.1 16S rRNA (cytosine1402-N4)-methyltransferase [Parvularcula dongshanensis]